ncbi:MAG: hypothetical protein UY03_C0023G0016 [Parcubacteria group bacterium GW2011_GWA2_47_64]|nr:MAG: hypothetical protein UY03_C0023G0016 [Parcubacteria group bacterium GW2011_GWA2_47_64]KKU96606.1 MAG: hypothetical protein UY29_C0009G0020 [Parcubacteria group bacterium GW2011_GWC2_48_17]
MVPPKEENHISYFSDIMSCKSWRRHPARDRGVSSIRVRYSLSVSTMKRFTRTKENFTCEKCGARVTGSGYTNHCPECLWSKHVDKNPGDRASLCGGSMEPSSVSVLGGDTCRIIHECKLCGFIRAQNAAKEDSIERLIKLSASPFKKP